jgi:hypothetical protein
MGCVSIEKKADNRIAEIVKKPHESELETTSELPKAQIKPA